MTARAARILRRRHRRAMLSRGRRRYRIETHGVFETPTEIRTIHEIPRER